MSNKYPVYLYYVQARMGVSNKYPVYLYYAQARMGVFLSSRTKVWIAGAQPKKTAKSARFGLK
jgi:hypothetical protein